MLDHLRQRVISVLVQTHFATLSTYGPATLQADTFPCEAAELVLYLLIPRTSDHLFNIEHDPVIILTTTTWQLRGTARILPPKTLPTHLEIFNRPDRQWCELLEITPTRLQIIRADSWGYCETIDID